MIHVVEHVDRAEEREHRHPAPLHDQMWAAFLKQLHIIRFDDDDDDCVPPRG